MFHIMEATDIKIYTSLVIDVMSLHYLQLISFHTIIKMLQMQLPVAEDLLRNTENLAILIGDALDATAGNISNSSITIIQENIGMYIIITRLLKKFEFKKGNRDHNKSKKTSSSVANKLSLTTQHCIYTACVYSSIQLQLGSYVHSYMHKLNTFSSTSTRFNPYLAA